MKLKPVIKFDGPDKYIFVNGVAKVPGTNMTITLNEFKAIRSEQNKEKKNGIHNRTM